MQQLSPAESIFWLNCQNMSFGQELTSLCLDMVTIYMALASWAVCALQILPAGLVEAVPDQWLHKMHPYGTPDADSPPRRHQSCMLVHACRHCQCTTASFMVVESLHCKTLVSLTTVYFKRVWL